MSEVKLPSEEVVSSVLSFYSSQLTSHTSMLVGFIVAFFTLLQARGSIVGETAQGLFQFGAITIVSAAGYSMMRVVLYGSLSGVLMNVGKTEWTAFSPTWTEKLLEHALVNKFASDELLKYTPVRRLMYKRRGVSVVRNEDKRLFYIQLPMAVSVVVAIVVVAVMFNWSLDLAIVAIGLLVSIVSLVWFVSFVRVLALRFLRHLRKDMVSS